MKIAITSEELRRIAHAAALHYEAMQKREGALPLTEDGLLRVARQIEAAIPTAQFVVTKGVEK